MAIAVDSEYGLFIGGELTEPTSGEVRKLTEPNMAIRSLGLRC